LLKAIAANARSKIDDFMATGLKFYKMKLLLLCDL